MSPHNDAPSPAGSFSNGLDRVPFRASTGLRIGSLTPSETQSPLSSSFDSASLETSAFQMARPLVPGVYVPTVCFFEPGTEDVDTATIARHAVKLARAGVTGLTTQGSNGEAVHLSHSERQLVTATTRKALDDAGFARMPLIVGCGAQSTRETIQLCHEAWEAGGDYALVLAPSYYAPLFAPAAQTVLDFFHAVADASPIPILIYNFPGAANGLDLSSDVILHLAEHPNIVGVKLTCGNTGKLARVAAGTRKRAAAAAAAARKLHPNDHDDHEQEQRDPLDPAGGAPDFLVLAGSADFTLQALVAGGHGILAGLANVAPRACVRTLELWRAGKAAEARALQDAVAQGDWAAIQGGVVGVKAAMQAWMGYGGHARSPLPQPGPEQQAVWKEAFRDLVMLEKSL